MGAALAWGLRPLLEAGELVLAFGAGALLTGLVGELVLALRAIGAHRSAVAVAPAGAAPADGAVELLAVRAVRRTPNRRDPRFFAFAGVDADPVPYDRALPETRSSPPLLGRVAVISVFLGRDGRGWSDLEIAQAHAALFRAGEWIEREATRWGAAVNIALADTYFAVDDGETGDVEMTFAVEGEDVGPIEARAATKALIDSSRAARTLGFRDAVDWMAAIRARVQADAVVWLLHPRCAGRSLVVPLDQTELAGVSLAVCYAREASFPEPLSRLPFTDPVTVAHELLHLFGATDKYGRPLRRYPPRSVSSRDIMRLSETRLPRLRIDPITAQEIGWGSGEDRSRDEEPER